jgi:hypothetical protein
MIYAGFPRATIAYPILGQFWHTTRLQISTRFEIGYVSGIVNMNETLSISIVMTAADTRSGAPTISSFKKHLWH